MPVVKSQVTGSRSSGGNITSASLSVAAGDVIVAMLTSQDSNTSNIGATAVTFGGKSFTKRGGQGGQGGTGEPNYAECWYLTNPTPGSGTAQANFNGTINECSATFYVLSGADAAALFDGTDASGHANGTPSSMSITTAYNSSFLIAALTSESTISGVGAGQDDDATLTDQSFENTRVSSKQGGAAGSQSMSFTVSFGANYAQYMVAIKAAPATIALSGTGATGMQEADVVAGGKTIILTLTNDTFVASGATFDGQRQNIINGMVSAGSESNGWNNQVKAKIGVSDVVRTSATVVTITLDAESQYSILAREVITVTVPSTALTGGVAVVASPTFAVSAKATSFLKMETGNFIKLETGNRIGKET